MALLAPRRERDKLPGANRRVFRLSTRSFGDLRQGDSRAVDQQ